MNVTWFALLCWLGALKLFSNIRETAPFFNRARKTAFWGFFFGFLLYMVGFIVIGGEWFSMWQSHTWNGQMTAGLFVNQDLRKTPRSRQKDFLMREFRYTK